MVAVLGRARGAGQEKKYIVRNSIIHMQIAPIKYPDALLSFSGGEIFALKNMSDLTP